MSRAEHRRHDRSQRRRPGGTHRSKVSIQGYASTVELLPEARQATHDALVAMTGASRRSAVSWVWFEGDEALQVLTDQAVANGRDPIADAHDRQIREWLTQYGGYLVIAIAEVAT